MMARRIVVEVVLIIGITVALAWPVLGLFGLTGSADPVATFVDQTPRVLFGLLGIALGVWTLLVVIGAIVLRRRGRGARIASHLISLVIALVINVALLTVFATAANGGEGESWGMVVVAIAAAASIALFVAGVIAVLLVELVIVRPRHTVRSAAEPVLSPR